MFCNNTQAQHTYSHLYNTFNEWEAVRSVFHNTPSGGFTIAAMTKNFGGTDSSNNRRIFISSIDSAGLMAQKKVILGKNDCYLTVHDIYEYPNHSTMYFNIENQLLPDSFYYALIDIDKNGDTTNQRLIELPEDNFLVNSHSTINNKIYSFGFVGYSNTAPFSLLVSDTSGKIIWFKKHLGKRTRANNVIMDTDGNFMVAGNIYKGDGISDTAFGWYAKMDTLGNFLWEKTMDYNSPYPNLGCFVFQIDQTVFIISANDASYFYSPVKDTSFVSLMKLDNIGNIIWYKRPYTSAWGLNVHYGPFIKKGNAMYAIGGEQSSEGVANFSDYILLVKLDLEGNLIWQRKFKQWYRDNRAYSLTAISDGFIICADGKDTTHTTGFSDAWIIKTDTNGCVVPGCNLKDGMVQLLNPDAFLNVYPNPATDKVFISSMDDKAQLKSIIVYDSKGNKLTEQKTNNTKQYLLETNGFAQGNYYLVIELQTGERAVKKIMIQHE